MNSPPRPNIEPISRTTALIPPSRTAVFRPLKWLCTSRILSGTDPPRQRATDPPSSGRGPRHIGPGTRSVRGRGHGGRMAGMAEETLARGVHTELRDRVALITVSDPERRNAMAVDLSAQLVEQIQRAE